MQLKILTKIVFILFAKLKKYDILCFITKEKYERTS